LKLAASLDQASPHVVAEALVKAAKIRGIRLSLPKEVEEISGHAITGFVDGFKVKVGQPPTVLPEWAAMDESLLIAVEIDGLLCAMIGLADPIRNESAETIVALRREGIERVVLVTGDREESATSVGNAVGVDEIHFRCTPADKMLFLKQEQARTNGIVATAIRIAKQSRLRALQSAGLGMTLSFIAMIFASVGLLTASEGAVVQEFIDSAAIIWALTALRSVGRVKPDKPTPLE
jgi:cation transport ATPase